MTGVSAFGAYIPRLRLQRSAIAAANVWFDASLKGHARGERAMCNWDEDPVTMRRREIAVRLVSLAR